jgi:hypothetical protein
MKLKGITKCLHTYSHLIPVLNACISPNRIEIWNILFPTECIWGQEDSQTVLRAAGETEAKQESIQDWLQLDGGDPGFQLVFL